MSKTVSQLPEATSLPSEAILPVVVAGNSRRATVATLQAEVASVVADGVDVYETKAHADADIANISADAFVQVLIDEDRNGHRTIYQKSSGSLVFKKDLSLGSVFYPEEFGAICYSTRTAAISGTVSTAAFSAMFAAWYAAGGGEVWLSGWYAVDEAFQLDNSNTETEIGTQPPLKINGIGGQGTYARPVGGAGIVWTAETGDAVAKLTTLGRGLLILDNCVFASAPSSGNTKPFVHTTFTTIKTGAGFAFDGAVYGSSADEDGFILGGQTGHESDAGFDRRSPDCGFQGYGTVIDRVYCNGIRRLAVLQRYANAIRITNNVVWNTCGNDSATGGAIEVDGAPIAPTTAAYSAVISNNLVEMYHYKHPIYLKNCVQSQLDGNDFYDHSANNVAGVYVDATCANIRIVPSVCQSVPYLSDPGGVCYVFGSEPGYYDRVNSLKAGISGYPNLFGSTVFNTADTVIQPTTPPAVPGGKVLVSKRSASDGTDPGVENFSINYGGGINVNGSLAGNISNGNTAGASFIINGTRWVANTAANMRQHSGAAGGYMDMHNLATRFFNNSDVYQCRIGTGGMRWGTSSTVDDLAIARNAAGVLEVNSGTAGTLRDIKVRSTIQSPPASVTPAANGELVVEATSNTTLTFKLKGSDGTVRTGTLTLS